MPKKALDTNKPRGPVTAYALFLQTCRSELKRKYPQLAVDYNVIVKKCSERWKAMNENEKKRFNDTAELHRKRYKEELANYQQEQQAKQQQQQQQSATSSILLPNSSNPFLVDSCSVAQLSTNQSTSSHSLLMPTTNLQSGTTLIAPAAPPTVTAMPIVPTKKPPRKRKPKDPHAPKKPLSAYFLFCADERPKVHGSQSGMSVSDVARELGIRWKQAPTELKTKYEQAASEKKDVYKAEMALYKNQTSTSSSPPETPQSPPTPHDFPSTNHPIHSHLNQVFQSQDFHSFDMNENLVEFDMITNAAASTNSTPSSYIVAATSNPVPAAPSANGTIDNSSTIPAALNDIKLICTRRKKKTKRHIYVTFVEMRSLSSSSDQPCIELLGKTSGSSNSSTIYPFHQCLSFEYFDTVKNDFQSFIYVYFESYTISIYFSDDHLEKKSIIIKHLEALFRSKSDGNSEINNNTNSITNPTNLSSDTIQPASQQSILPCPSTTEHILHTFDVNLIPFGTIISRDHLLIGPARLYFTTTDLYIASIHCQRQYLKVTIANQCPSKDKSILCIPYFTIKNYGNRSNIFLIELGKSTYGNGEIHMKCQSSSLASTIHLLVSPVIEERPLILSSAFQNQLLTNKRIEKSKNIHPPIQLSNETNQPTTNSSIFDSPVAFLKSKSTESTNNDTRTNSTRTTDMKSRLVVGFFRSLTKNVAHLRRSATFHQNSSYHSSITSQDANSLPKMKSVGFNIEEKRFSSDQHQIVLPESQKKSTEINPIVAPSIMTQKSSEPILSPPTSLSTNTLDPNRSINTMGTYIDMGPTVVKTDVQEEEKLEEEPMAEETSTNVDVGVNTTISLSPRVRSAIIVGNSVHLIADEKTLFPIGQRSFTSPACVMQPFKTQLNGQPVINAYVPSTEVITSSPNSSNSLHQLNSTSTSQKSLLLSYGIVTFKNNETTLNEQNERATSPPLDGSTIDRRLNSDLSLISFNQGSSHQQSISNIYPLDGVLTSSSAHIFRTLSVSTTNIGDNHSTSMRTPHGSIIFFDDHLNEQTATYLLGPPIAPISDEPTVQSNNMSTSTSATTLPRLSSFNLTSSMSRSQLSYIDEEKSSNHDPYALVEPLSDPLSIPSSSLITRTLPQSKSVNYADLSIPSDHSTLESNETIEQNGSNNEETKEESTENPDDEHLQSTGMNNNQRSSTILYTDIDFHQTRRRDRIAQFAAKAKLEDQTPPFVL